ncbi:MAG: hypothetical protein ACYC9Z_10725 [Casimicrobiaceae bacterium]
MVRKLDEIDYRGGYSFDVYNDDYQQMPPEKVTARARRAAEWLAEAVLRRARRVLRPANIDAGWRGQWRHRHVLP